MGKVLGRRAKKPYISVIIPAYNSNPSLIRLLKSLRSSRFGDFEVIVGDDASADELSAISLQQSARKKEFTLHYVRLSRNRGPAAARNEAAMKAKGRVLLFLDSDVEVYPDTLNNVAKKFQADADLTALTGVWDKHQRSADFFPQFKALRDWSYWINERDSEGYYYLFSTRIAAMKRDVFRRLGGFNETFRQMEDVELTYRIARRYAIIFAPDVRVHHEFEGFWKVAKKYFWRSVYWSKLYQARRKFDPVATTMWETLTAVTGVGAIALIVLGFLFAGFFAMTNFQLPLLKQLSVISYQLSILFFFIHVVFLRKFLLFVYREKGIWFTAQSFFVGLLLYCAIVAGASYYRLGKVLR
jgi:glycosyltransferase involved in cell wall biosynthesis